MNFEVIPTPDFAKALKALAKRHKSIKKDILDFSESLKRNPFQGDELTPGIRKIRMAITSTFQLTKGSSINISLFNGYNNNKQLRHLLQRGYIQRSDSDGNWKIFACPSA